MQVAVAAIVAVLVGLGIGYVVWGSQAGQMQSDVDAARARLGQMRQAAQREGELTTKVQDVEGKVKQAEEQLRNESELVKKLEAVAKRKKK
jgi:uncharacterized protein HemX